MRGSVVIANRGGGVLQKFNLGKPSGALNWLVICAWGLLPLGYIEVILHRIPIVGLLSPAFQPVLFLLLISISISRLSRYIRLIDLLTYIFCVAVYLMQYILFPRNTEILDQYFLRFVLQALPFYFIGLIIDVKEMDKALYWVSVISIWMVVFYLFVYKRSQEGMPSDDEIEEKMSIAYLTLPYVMYVFWNLLRNFSLIGLVTTILGTLFLFSCGTRGPIVCLTAFVVLYILIYNNWSKTTKIIVFSIVAVLAAIVINYLDIILLFFQELSVQLGVSNRVFSMLESGEMISYTSGRDNISERLWDVVKTGNLFGYGIGGTWQFVGMYAHNLVLDLLVSFGPLLGGLFFGIIVWAIYLGFKKSRGLTRGFILMLICCSFLKLFMSHIFLTESMLFLLLGLCVQTIRRGDSCQ